MSTTSSVAVTSVFESPTNPRKQYSGIEELAESIRTYGVLQPILVRPSESNAYECVFGHRRLRAAKLLGLEAIPATIRDLTDTEVLEAQLIENTQRQDIHPLEEGAAYHQLHESLGYTVDEIAAKVGKSRETVYARMKLCALSDGPRAALLEGTLTPSIALLIARIPVEKLQDEALKKLTTKNYEGDPPSYRSALEIVQRDFMLRLAGAPFSPKAADLVPGVCACVVCPKRTGAQPDIFPDVSHADVCTDPTCFAAKRDAAWAVRAAKAKDEGQRVLSAKESKAAFGYENRPSYEWLEAKGKTWVNGLSGETTPNALAKKAGVDLEVVLARDPAGGFHELVERKAVEALARKVAKQGT